MSIEGILLILILSLTFLSFCGGTTNEKEL